MLAMIKKLFIKEKEEKTTMALIQPPYWYATYPEYYKMLRHEFAADGIRFQNDVITPITATFDFINAMAVDVAQKDILKERCIANAAFSARAANGVYFSRKTKEEENWSHETWIQSEHEWQYAVFYASLLINATKNQPGKNNINLNDLSININNDNLALAINNTINNTNQDTMPIHFFSLVNRMTQKTQTHLNATQNSKTPIKSKHQPNQI